MSRSKSTSLATLFSSLLIILTSSGIVRSETSGHPKNAANRLYVANTGDNSVEVFPIGKFGNVAPFGPPPRLSSPRGIAHDAANNIYVADTGSNEITVCEPFAGGSLNPIAVIGGSKTGLRKPVGVAIDTKGNIYVVNAKGGNTRKGSITVYRHGSHGNVRPTAVITGPRTGFFRPAGIALDATGDILVTNHADGTGYGSVSVFRAASRRNAPPIRKISGSRTRLKNPVGIAVGARGDIYVANDSGGAGTIEVFRSGSAGNVSPARTIDSSCSGLDGPQGVAVDSTGNIYVSNDGQRLEAHASGITVYSGDSNGCTMPAATICGNDTGLSQPSGLMLDSKRNIYVTDLAPDSVAMSVFAPPETIPATEPTPSVGTKRNNNTWSLNAGFRAGAGCTALTPSDGNAPPIAVFANSNNQPNAEMDRPYGVALDKSGKIYVANGGTVGRGVDSITVYPPGSNANVSPIATIVGDGGDRSNDKTGLSAPEAIALDADENIYVANGQADGSSDAIGTITIYASGSNGNAAPVRTIVGAKTEVNGPVSIAIDSAGYLYVLNSSGGPDSAGSVTIYAPHSNGDVAPVRTIINSDPDHPDFDNPAGLALDAGNNIYVANSGSSDSYSAKEDIAALAASIIIYPAGSNGKVSPSATIKGSLTQLDGPSGIVVDSIGNIFVTNDAGSGRAPLDFISVYPPHSNGNVAPAMRLSDGGIIRHAVIKGSLTGLDQPAGMAIGPD